MITGDGICDDIANTLECNYDGYDCCVTQFFIDIPNLDFCDDCQCYINVPYEVMFPFPPISVDETTCPEHIKVGDG